MAKKLSDEKLDKLEKQIKEKSISYEYSTREYPLEVIHSKFGDKNNPETDIYVPDYQREFVWNPDQQSKFIESLLLGVPITPILFAEDEDLHYEIIDGSQRVRTIIAFIDNVLKLRKLDTLTELNGLKFSDLPKYYQSVFKKRDFRILVVTKNSDPAIRRDVFNRVNTTGEGLTDSEIRKGSYSGKFYDLVIELAALKDFQDICPVTDKSQTRGEYEELVLRFLAYKDRYCDFKHDVAIFLNSYLDDMNNESDLNPEVLNNNRQDFNDMIRFVGEVFPDGFRKETNSGSTPRVRFEALSVGTFLAYKTGKTINKDIKWINSDEFKNLVTSDSSNNKDRLKNRIEYVRNKLTSEG